MTNILTRDEAELYDRQIRLWGVNAQRKIRQSKILMLGFDGLASEVAKIVVLAGIDTLTIVDDRPLQPEDISSNLFCRPSSDDENKEFRTHSVIPKLKILNPSVKVNLDNSSISSKSVEDFKNYDLVTLHSFMDMKDICDINDKCRSVNAKFYVALNFGFFGLIFSDLGSDFHYSYEEYVPLKEKAVDNEVIPLDSNNHRIEDNDNEDEDDDDSDGEYVNPKKKRRLRSPQREDVKEQTNQDVNDKQTKFGQLSFSNFRDFIYSKDLIFNKSTSPVLILSLALIKFYSIYKHLPRDEDNQIKQDDLKKLKQILETIKNSCKVPENVMKKLDQEWAESIYGSISPVCAILGGVAGQDMIRALSNKDIPIFNTFSFDGLTMNGVVEKVGLNADINNSRKPVVRDVLQIDDSDSD